MKLIRIREIIDTYPWPGIGAEQRGKQNRLPGDTACRPETPLRDTPLLRIKQAQLISGCVILVIFVY